MSKKKAVKPEGIPRLLTGQQLAKFFGVSTGFISGRTSSEVLKPVNGKARKGAKALYDVQESAAALMGEKVAQPEADRSIVAREQAERLRIGNMRERGELLDAHLVEEGLKAAMAGLLQDWDALAQRVTTDETIQAAVASECRGAQERFAKVLADLADSFAARAAETAKDGSRMG
jgi:hypothetical protein